MEKIKTRVVLEIIGRPKEHIVSSLNSLIDKLSKEKGVFLIKKDVKEPIEIPESKDLYSTFAELEIDMDSFEICMGILFAYMPSNIEIISPENLSIKNIDLNMLTNRLISRLHNYDALAKRIVKERDFLVKKLKEVAPELFKKEKEEGSKEPK